MMYTLKKLYEAKFLHVQILLHVELEGVTGKSDTRPEMLSLLFSACFSVEGEMDTGQFE